ncbi:MAG TPA: hypothetical protein VE604_04335 [Candidatus Polarisedimenticolia bacterium]|nr:hypothetical protein [Candidatus Polarisedimenticolia bacterium]
MKRKALKVAKSRKQKAAPVQSASTLLSVAGNSRKTVKQRVAALANMSTAVCEDDKTLQAMLNILRDPSQAIEVRLAALQSLQAASFSVIAFESCHNDYIAALRAVATDSNPELRQRVFGLLAREKDGYAQEKLLEGLRDPKKALLPPEKALQLLSYDVHAEAYSVARALVNNPPNPTAKREALRLLGADTNSAPMFEKVLRDKDELSENRQISAAALQTIDPEKLQKHAREILLDPSDYKEIQATSLTALTQFGGKAVADDTALLKRVNSLSDKAPTMLKQSARRFLGKYGR